MNIMELASGQYAGTKEEISSITGIPTGKTSGKVIPHIQYAAFMGLICYQKDSSVYRLSLTPMGKAVWKEDKYLFEDVTKWLCHYFITDVNTGAYLWALLYKWLPYQLDSQISYELLERKNTETFGKSFDIGVVKRTYSEGFFESLDVIDWSDGIIFNSCFYKNSLKYVYAYTLLSQWEKDFADEREMTLEQISNVMMWSRRFGFDETEMMNVLDELEAEHMIKINHQLHPCTVIKMESSENIIPKLYSELA